MNPPYPHHFLEPASAARDTLSKQKTETIRIAKEQEKAIHEKLARNNDPIPKYEFLELIGKGAYGRVFKCLDQTENRIVALKVIDVDSHDYKVNAREKDDSIEVTLHEIKVLKQLKDANTKNVNFIFDAFQIHSQLWIVNEYCPGGSVRTLMRSTGDRLINKFVVPIARELAIALKAIHDGGIIHRDVKAANVMIHEDGRLQVIDFGVAGVLQTNLDKRSTVIGTPHWMAPELHKLAPREGLTYGTEVDVWAYGCTLYEIAMGMPPYPKTQPGRQLGITLGRTPPRLNELDHDKGLCDIVAFVLEAKPMERPSMEAVLQHSYILNSEESYPTNSLAELVKIYYRWEHSGGQRQSLFINAGAAAAEFPANIPGEEDWNFSTTMNFEQEIFKDSFASSTSSSYNDYGCTVQAHEENSAKGEFSSIPAVAITDQPSRYYSDSAPPWGTELTPTGARTPVEKLNTEERVKRGQDAMKGLFDEQQAPYVYQIKADFVEQKSVPGAGSFDPVKNSARSSSDLPLRDESVQSSVHRKEFDADQVRSATYENLPNIDLANVGTIKANRMNKFLDNMGHDNRDDNPYYYGNHLEEDKRATKEWTFPNPVSDSAAQDPKRATIEWGFPPELSVIQEDWHLPLARPNLRHAVTAPVGEIEHSSEMIDLDALYDDPHYDNKMLSVAPGSDHDRSSRSNNLDNARKTQVSDAVMSASDADDELETPHGIGSKESITNSDAALSEDELNLKRIAKSGTSSLASSDSDIGYDPSADWEPFGFDDEALIEKSRKEFELHLDSEGVTDPLEHARFADVSNEEFKKRRLKGAGDFLEKNHTLWALFDPKVDSNGPQDPWMDPVRPSDPEFELEGPDNPWSDPPAWSSNPDIPLAQGLKTAFTNKAGSSNKSIKDGAQYPSASALEAAALKFPEIVPPSTESLSASAPIAVLEAELKRLLGDWTQGLDVLGELVANVQKHVGEGSAYGGGGGGRAAGEQEKAMHKHKQGNGRGRGRAAGNGNGTDIGTSTGTSTGDVSTSGDEDANLYLDLEKSNAVSANPVPDAAAPVPQGPQGPVPPAKDD